MAEPAYRWVIVAAGGLMGCAVMGAMFSLPVLLNGMAEDTGWSRTGISAAMTLGFLAMALSAMFWGALSDRIGPRPVVMVGAVAFTGSLWAASAAPTLPVFQLCFGLGLGISVAAFFAPVMATVTGWFETQRGLAVSLVSAGMGLAPVTMSPLAAWLTESHDWRGVLAILAVVVAAVTLPLSLLMRPPPAAAYVAEATAPSMRLRDAVTSAPFLILLAVNFFCCATHSGPIFHTVSYAEICGLSALAAVSIYSVEGIAGMGGRIGFGVMGDRFGAKRILVLGLFAQAVAVAGYLFASDLWSFYIVAAVFGFIYGGIMPLYSVLVRENFPLRMLGTIMGGIGMAGGLGMATGPVLGGWIFDRTGEYGGLYLTCLGLGLAAGAIMLAFRPYPRLPGAEPAAA
jgi:MFS family permease